MNRDKHIKLALEEDCCRQDVTTKLLPIHRKCKAIIKIKETSHVYGIRWLEQVFKQIDKKVKIKFYIKDGQYTKKNTIIAEIIGSNHSLLKSERVALNYLQAMSGTYDLCKRFQKKIKHTKIKLLHTRKTLPLFRAPLKEACIAAGCMPHREDLSTAVLIKENHLQYTANPIELIKKAIANNKKVVVEAKTLKFAKSLNQIKIDRVLLDNFTPLMLKKFIQCNSNLKIEVSGSINIKNIQKFATKGVHYISIGALTKNIESKDFSMLIV